MKILDIIRNYTFVPSGEAIRGLEVTIAWAVVDSLSQKNWSTMSDWRTWLAGLGAGVMVAAIAYIKGKLPAKEV